MNVLFLTHRVPYAPNRGDRVRAFHLLRELSKWADVDVVALAHDADEAAHAGDLRDVTRSVAAARVPKVRNLLRAALALPSSRPTTHSLLAAPAFERAVDEAAASRKPDVVFAYCTGIAPAAFRPSLRGAPVILDMVDVDSQKWAAMAGSSKPPLSWVYAREAKRLQEFEASASVRAALTLVVNDRERLALTAIAPNARIEVIQNGVDIETLRPPDPPATDPTVVFCGVMNYAPNIEGALWLAREVWPAVRSRMPSARLSIIGAQPTHAVRALTDESAGVEVKGSVPDVRPHLWEAAVAVAPLHTARGVQNKVLEAVAAGLPVVVTSAVMEGLPEEAKSACREARTAPAFAEAILTLLNSSPEARRTLAAGSGLEKLTWERRLQGLAALTQDVSKGVR